MSREIKFRSWNIKSKKLVDLKSITPLALAIDPSIAGANSCGVYVPDHNDIIIEQYTGIKDERGMEIYEGDQILDGILYTVCWSEMDSGFIGKYHHMEDPEESTVYDLRGGVVVGNIHGTTRD